eukprot:6501922-Pyramimonas_sp.AAC.1
MAECLVQTPHRSRAAGTRTAGTRKKRADAVGGWLNAADIGCIAQQARADPLARNMRHRLRPQC